MFRIALVLLLSVLTPSAFAGGGGGPGLTGEAIVIGDVVNVRQSPGPAGAIVAAAREGDTLTILSWEPDEATVGTLTDRWARVRLAGGATGYVFGGFLFELTDFAGTWVVREFGGGAAYTLRADGGLDGESMSETGKGTLAGSWSRDGRKVRLNLGAGSTCDVYLFRYKGRRCLAPTRQAPSTPVHTECLTSSGELIGYFFKKAE